MERLHTRVPGDGVCRQTTDYTCGPAAAVTVLRKLGLQAEEGTIAINSGTSPTMGTPPDILAETLNSMYRTNGLTAEHRMFRGIDDLKAAGLTLAVVKFGFLVDHYVAVLGVTDTQVIVGDPLDGLDKISHQDFLERWQFAGVVLKQGH